MTTYSVTIDEHADRRLHRIAAATGQSVEDLIASAAEAAALDVFRHRADDPAKPPRTGVR